MKTPPIHVATTITKVAQLVLNQDQVEELLRQWGDKTLPGEGGKIEVIFSGEVDPDFNEDPPLRVTIRRETFSTGHP